MKEAQQIAAQFPILPRRAFASRRCPHCGFWLVAVERTGEWFCTVCGSQIEDALTTANLVKKADLKDVALEYDRVQLLLFDEHRESRGLGAPQKGNTVTVGQWPLNPDFAKWRDQKYREKWIEDNPPFLSLGSFAVTGFPKLLTLSSDSATERGDKKDGSARNKKKNEGMEKQVTGGNQKDKQSNLPEMRPYFPVG